VSILFSDGCSVFWVRTTQNLDTHPNLNSGNIAFLVVRTYYLRALQNILNGLNPKFYPEVQCSVPCSFFCSHPSHDDGHARTRLYTLQIFSSLLGFNRDWSKAATATLHGNYHSLVPLGIVINDSMICNKAEPTISNERKMKKQKTSHGYPHSGKKVFLFWWSRYCNIPYFSES
jgi:hypothetical protein